MKKFILNRSVIILILSVFIFLIPCCTESKQGIMKQKNNDNNLEDIKTNNEINIDDTEWEIVDFKNRDLGREIPDWIYKTSSDFKTDERYLLSDGLIYR